MSSYLLHFLLDRLAHVLATVGVGILLCDDEGQPRYASDPAAQYLDPDGKTGVCAQIRELVRRCVEERTAELGALSRPLKRVIGAAGVDVAVGVVAIPDGALAVVSPVHRLEDDLDIPDAFGLTPAEHAVARLLVLRLTNKEIAAELGLSYHTVKHRVERVLHKLGVTSRHEVARYLAGGARSAGKAGRTR
jgi:DNA-binding CsgD family transcriptional regulator